MPFGDSPGTIYSSPGNTSPSAYQQSGFLTGPPVWNAQPYAEVRVGGETAVAVHIKSVDISMGMDISFATATVECYDDPLIAQGTEIQIICGAGPFNASRFRGIVRRTRSNLWPHTFSLIAQGMLSLADKYRQSVGAGQPSFITQRLPFPGLSIFDLMGQLVDASDSEAVAAALPDLQSTDENYIRAVLSYVPGLNVDPADIGGTGHVFGTLAWRDLSWPPYVSALAQCRKLDEVCLGYRLFESLNGRIMRTQVYGYPNDAVDATFTEGIDVLTAVGERSIEDLFNGEYVEGYSLGGVSGLISAYAVEANDFQSADNPVVDTYSSPLIEDTAFAEEVRDWKLTEGNRELVDITLTTFRDDLLVPGRTVSIDIPHASVHGEPIWIQHVDIRVQAKPIMFRQVIRGKGGGEPGSYRAPDPY